MAKKTDVLVIMAFVNFVLYGPLYKHVYLLFEFMYTRCVNASYDYLFVYLLQVTGCSSCCDVFCFCFTNACRAELIPYFIMCMCRYLMFVILVILQISGHRRQYMSFMCNMY